MSASRSLTANARPSLTMHLTRFLQFLTGCAAILVAQSATAASSSWNVDANGNWATVANPPWYAALVPGSTSSTTNTDVATFGFTLTLDRTVTVDANRNLRGITFSNTSTNKYTLSGGRLLLTNGGVIQTAAGNGDHTDTISTAMVIEGDGGSATFTAGATSAASTLSIGAVTGVATGANTTTLTLNGDNVGENAVTGVIGNGTGGGKVALTKSGNGIWNLAGNNTFSGQLTVAQGILKV
ncbi:MAG: autotransporter-associated beta strand repeat-containing protein, partial [Verrucomicrobiota bacterium]